MAKVTLTKNKRQTKKEKSKKVKELQGVTMLNLPKFRKPHNKRKKNKN